MFELNIKRSATEGQGPSYGKATLRPSLLYIYFLYVTSSLLYSYSLYYFSNLLLIEKRRIKKYSSSSYTKMTLRIAATPEMCVAGPH